MPFKLLMPQPAGSLRVCGGWRGCGGELGSEKLCITLIDVKTQDKLC